MCKECSLDNIMKNKEGIKKVKNKKKNPDQYELISKNKSSVVKKNNDEHIKIKINMNEDNIDLCSNIALKFIILLFL